MPPRSIICRVRVTNSLAMSSYPCWRNPQYRYQFMLTQLGPRKIALVANAGSKLGSFAATLGIGKGSQNSASLSRCSFTSWRTMFASISFKISKKRQLQVSIFSGCSSEPLRSQKAHFCSSQHFQLMRREYGLTEVQVPPLLPLDIQPFGKGRQALA